jgi:hypothetical protein
MCAHFVVLKNKKIEPRLIFERSYKLLLVGTGHWPALNSAANGMHYFNLVVFLDLGCGIFGPGNDLFVQGHGEIRCLNLQFLNQILKVLAFQDFPVFAING